MKIRTKITLAFFLLAFVSLFILTVIIYRVASESMVSIAYERLASLKEEKSYQIEKYFEDLGNTVSLFSSDPTTIEASKELLSGFTDLKDVDASEQQINNLESFYRDSIYVKLKEKIDLFPESSVTKLLQYIYLSNNPYDIGLKDGLVSVAYDGIYFDAHEKYHDYFKRFREAYGYYDVFIVGVDGNVVYSVFKETDYATNLIDGPYADQNMAKVFAAVLSDKKADTKMVDYQPYVPSYNDPASFIASPIADNGQVVAVLIVQISQKVINNIMTSEKTWKNKGFGASGEAYLVGGDYLMRSDSRFLIEEKDRYLSMLRDAGIDQDSINSMDTHNTTILFQMVQSDSVTRAFNGEKGTHVVEDYRGVEVLSSYAKLNIKDLDWVILSEIDKNEVMEPVLYFRDIMIISSVVISLMVILIATLMGMRFTYPVLYLLKACGDLGKGIVSMTPLVQRRDEFKQLGEALIDADRKILKDSGELENEILKRKKLQVLLVEARESAERSNISKTKFLSLMSHELKTSLNHIIGFSQLLEIDESIQGNQKENVKYILSSGKVLSDLIEKMFQYSEIVSEDYKVKINIFNLSDTVVRSLDNVKKVADEKEVAISLSTEFDQAHKVIGDEKAFALAIEEIVNNAIQYTGSGGMVKLQLDSDRYGFLGVGIEDNGIGIPADQLDNIFQPFTRTNEDTNVIGVGLGLTNAYRVVSLMGGSIEVVSQGDMGSKFTIFIPRIVEGKKSLAPNKLRKVVYVDDDPDMISIVEFSLEVHGEVGVEVFSSAEEALCALPDLMPDLIISDYLMPVKNGEEFLNDLRDNEETKHIPLVFVSGSTAKDLYSKYKHKGVIGYITKPIDPLELPGKIIDIWNRHIADK